jgi:hypothetical protein
MLLTGKDTRFELNVVSYEFPRAKAEKYDANWLSIKIKVKSLKGSWESTDPMLLTWDIKNLVQWFEDILINKEENKEIDFLEPNLRFVKIKDTKDKIFIRSYFELEARPKWAKSNVAGEKNLWIDLSPSKEEMRIAIEDLRSQFKKFPIRQENVK